MKPDGFSSMFKEKSFKKKAGLGPKNAMSTLSSGLATMFFTEPFGYLHCSRSAVSVSTVFWTTFVCSSYKKKLLLEWDQRKTLQDTSTALAALLSSFPEWTTQVLHLIVVRGAGIPMLEFDDEVVSIGEEVTDTSVFNPKDTVCLKLFFKWAIYNLGWNRNVSKEEQKLSQKINK